MVSGGRTLHSLAWAGRINRQGSPELFQRWRKPAAPQQDSDMKTAPREAAIVFRCVFRLQCPDASSPRQPINRPSNGVSVSRLLTSCRRKNAGELVVSLKSILSA